MEESLKHYRDLKEVVSTSFEDGEEVGIERGRKQREREIALKMKKKGTDMDLISEITGLSKEEIEQL